MSSVIQAQAKGYTVRVLVDGDYQTAELLVKPGTDFDGQFIGWDIDNGEWLKVSGWNCTVHQEGDR